ncbi:hypothetical protein Peur_029182 [Populus x canadensis]
MIAVTVKVGRWRVRMSRVSCPPKQPDYRTRKIKRAIWCWCIRRWKHTVFHSLPAHDLFNPWRDSFLYRWPSKDFGTLCLLCSGTLRVHDAGIESFMMIVASTVPDFLMGIITGAGIQGVMMLLEAFSRSPDRLPKPLRRYPMHSTSMQTKGSTRTILMGWHSLTI